MSKTWSWPSAQADTIYGIEIMTGTRVSLSSLKQQSLLLCGMGTLASACMVPAGVIYSLVRNKGAYLEDGEQTLAGDAEMLRARDEQLVGGERTETDGADVEGGEEGCLVSGEGRLRDGFHIDAFLIVAEEETI